MSTKYFCDFCGGEITERLSGGRLGGRLEAELQRGGHCLKVEVIHSTDGVGNAGDACKHCILDALAKADDRPTAGAKP